MSVLWFNFYSTADKQTSHTHRSWFMNKCSRDIFSLLWNRHFLFLFLSLPPTKPLSHLKRVFSLHARHSTNFGMCALLLGRKVEGRNTILCNFTSRIYSHVHRHLHRDEPSVYITTTYIGTYLYFKPWGSYQQVFKSLSIFMILTC